MQDFQSLEYIDHATMAHLQLTTADLQHSAEAEDRLDEPDDPNCDVDPDVLSDPLLEKLLAAWNETNNIHLVVEQQMGIGNTVTVHIGVAKE